MDDVRYIILPGDLRKDERLSLSHFKVAMVLGAYSKRNGWTDLTQSDVGEMAGLSRETVCRCVGDLVDWGWVARRKKNKKNQYVYRFIMDREDQCDQAVTEPEKQCDAPVTGNVISDLTSNVEETSTISKSTSGASAPATQDAARSPPEGEARLVLPHDETWRLWLTWLRHSGRYAVADAAEAEGAMIVYSHKPHTNCHVPKLAPLVGTPKRDSMEMMRAMSLGKGYRDPTGENAE